MQQVNNCASDGSMPFVIATASSILLQGEPAVGKYKVDVPAFERLALPQLSLKDQQLVVVDEVGA